jgi:hemoglobin
MTTKQVYRTLYEKVGGEDGVKKLVNTFYDKIETTEEGKPVLLLQLRGHGIAHARVEQVNFLSGFLGGPKLFIEKWGHSDIRKIHEHIEIDETASESWLNCMQMTVDELGYDSDLKGKLMDNFKQVADLIVKFSKQA